MKKVILFCLSAISLFATESTPQECSCPQNNTFTYGGVGSTGFFVPLIHGSTPILCGEIFVGRRTLNTHHVFDRNLGFGSALFNRSEGSVGDPSYLYGQISYLYFPKYSSGIYGGVGFTAGIAYLTYENHKQPGVWINVPLTIGYQTQRQNFLQLQVTPLCTATLSYGISFKHN